MAPEGFQAAPTRSVPISVLYLCYLGIADPLVHTQVVSYLEGLSQSGYCIVLCTFEPSGLCREERQSIRERLQRQGIEWHALRYHKRPALPATLVDVMAGIAYAARLVVARRISVVHARGHVPAMMAVGLKWLLGTRFLFDVRGLMAEEYVDAGLWRAGGFLYRLTKRMEAIFLKYADAIVILTDRAKQWLLRSGLTHDSPLVEVIPCCVDTRRFGVDAEYPKKLRLDLGLDEHSVMVYVGKLGTWYMASEMVDFFCAARRYFHDLRFLVLTQSSSTIIEDEFARKHVGPELYRCLRVSPDELPTYLGVADFAISFIAAGQSKFASSPTKIAEYLAAGLPVVYNAGLGDLDELERERVGVIVKTFAEAEYCNAARQVRQLLHEGRSTAARCHATAQMRFSLATVGTARYLKVYSALLGRHQRETHPVCGN